MIIALELLKHTHTVIGKHRNLAHEPKAHSALKFPASQKYLAPIRNHFSTDLRDPSHFHALFWIKGSLYSMHANTLHNGRWPPRWESQPPHPPTCRHSLRVQGRRGGGQPAFLATTWDAEGREGILTSLAAFGSDTQAKVMSQVETTSAGVLPRRAPSWMNKSHCKSHRSQCELQAVHNKHASQARDTVLSSPGWLPKAGGQSWGWDPRTRELVVWLLEGSRWGLLRPVLCFGTPGA